MKKAIFNQNTMDNHNKKIPSIGTPINKHSKNVFNKATRFLSQTKVIISVLAATSLGFCSLVWAGSVPGGDAIMDAKILMMENKILAEIKNTSSKMVALGFSSMSAFNQAMYQFDQNLLNTMNANTAATTVNQSLSSSGTTQTTQYIHSILQNIPDSFVSTGLATINASAIENQIKKQNALINNLTLGVPGSDTLYINQPDIISAGYGSFSPVTSKYYRSDVDYSIGPPQLNNDNYFSISSILEPSTYTPAQINAAQAYLAYLTQSYNNPASSLKLADLKGYINSLKSKDQSAALYKFISSSQYQSYQLALRSYMANKSIAINNFEHLMAERTPSKTKVSGIYDAKGNAIANPSPLQVAQYQANNRINNPAWIKSLQKMSSTSLQREIAVELAQLIQQNQQAHNDRERVLTTLSAMQLQESQASNMVLNTSAQQVNQEISGLGQDNQDNQTSDNNMSKYTQEITKKSKK